MFCSLLWALGALYFWSCVSNWILAQSLLGDETPMLCLLQYDRLVCLHTTYEFVLLLSSSASLRPEFSPTAWPPKPIEPLRTFWNNHMEIYFEESQFTRWNDRGSDTKGGDIRFWLCPRWTDPSSGQCGKPIHIRFVPDSWHTKQFTVYANKEEMIRVNEYTPNSSAQFSFHQVPNSSNLLTPPS